MTTIWEVEMEEFAKSWAKKPQSERVEAFSEGWSLTFAEDKITKVTYPDGRTTELGYDGERVKSVKWPDNSTWIEGDHSSHKWSDSKDSKYKKNAYVFVEDDGRVLTVDVDSNERRTLLPDGTVKTELVEMDGSRLQRLYRTALPQIDKNKDGELSRKELRSAVLDPKVKGEAARFAAIAFRSFDSLSTFSCKKPAWEQQIVKKDIESFQKYSDGGMDKQSRLLAKLNFGEKKANDIQHSMSIRDDNCYRDLYSCMGGAEESINPKYVKQGFLDDCYFHAAVAAVAQARPDLIRKMIHDNKDGSYTITFADQPKKHWRINTLTEAEKMLYATQTHGGLWPLLLEKAYGERQRQFWKDFGMGIFVDNKLPYQMTGNGARQSPVLKALTGEDSRELYPPFVSEDELANKLQKAVEQHAPITCATALTDLRPHPYDLKLGHAFTVMSYDAQGKFITIRNPLAENYRNCGDTFTMSLKEFKDNFVFLYIASRDK